MKCINKKSYIILISLLCAVFVFTGCGKKKIALSFDDLSKKSSFSSVKMKNDVVGGLAENYCVSVEDVPLNSIDAQMLNGAGLFDLNNKKVMFSSNLHKQFYPASLTKIVTAYIVLKEVEEGDISLETAVPIGPHTIINESGVAACMFLQGDTVSVEQALYVMMLRSDNGAAVALAELVSGSVEAFAERMNAEAVAIGATNSHFVNPNGLQNPDHYSTIYDLYLFLAKGMENKTFAKIFQTQYYETTITDKDGVPRTLNCKATNYYANEKSTAPEGAIFLGGKTGTTKAAGNCLIIYSSTTDGGSYIGVVLGAQDRDTVYLKMNEMLAQTVKK